MLIKDLIKSLEKEYENQEKYRDVFGEPSITLWTETGFTHDFKIAHTPDGVFAVLIKESEDE